MHDGRSESSDDGATVLAAETRAVCGGGCTDAVQHARVQPICSVSLGVLGQGKRAQSESSVGWYLRIILKMHAKPRRHRTGIFLPPRTEDRDKVSVCACRACPSPRHQTFATHTGGQASRRAGEQASVGGTSSHAHIPACSLLSAQAHPPRAPGHTRPWARHHKP
jgi:hypothetical protein